MIVTIIRINLFSWLIWSISNWIRASHFIEEERNESNRRSHKSGFMHAMKKHRNKQPEISNISAEKVTSESSTQNETSLEIAEAPDEKSKFRNIL